MAIWTCAECGERMESPSLPAYCVECGDAFIHAEPREPTDEETTRSGPVGLGYFDHGGRAF